MNTTTTVAVSTDCYVQLSDFGWFGCACRCISPSVVYSVKTQSIVDIIGADEPLPYYALPCAMNGQGPVEQPVDGSVACALELGRQYPTNVSPRKQAIPTLTTKLVVYGAPL